MKPRHDKPDDESEPASNTGRYLRYANLVVRFMVNVVKLVVMLTG